MVVAPLKHQAALLIIGVVFDFHDQMVVAPLKQRCLRGAAQDAFRFPRSDGRGPIEARNDLSIDTECPQDFHDQMVVAPLKRRVMRSARRDGRLFPRSDGRGPIEAVGDGTFRVTGWAISTIRWSWPH